MPGIVRVLWCTIVVTWFAAMEPANAQDELTSAQRIGTVAMVVTRRAQGVVLSSVLVETHGIPEAGTEALYPFRYRGSLFKRQSQSLFVRVSPSGLATGDLVVGHMTPTGDTVTIREGRRQVTLREYTASGRLMILDPQEIKPLVAVPNANAAVVASPYPHN